MNGKFIMYFFFQEKIIKFIETKEKVIIIITFKNDEKINKK
jgi:hypothetical protein